MKATVITIDIDGSYFSIIPNFSKILSQIPMTRKTRMLKSTMMMMIGNWNRDLISSMNKEEIGKRNLDATTLENTLAST